MSIPERIVDAVFDAPFVLFDRVKGRGPLLRVAGMISYPILAILCLPLLFVVVLPCMVCLAVLDMWDDSQ